MRALLVGPYLLERDLKYKQLCAQFIVVLYWVHRDSHNKKGPNGLLRIRIPLRGVRTEYASFFLGYGNKGRLSDL